MGQSFNIGGRNSEYGILDFSKLRNGIKLSDLNNVSEYSDILIKIFGDDEVLDAADIDRLQEYISGAADGDNTLTNKEVRNANNNLFEGLLKTKEDVTKLFAVLKALAEKTSGIANVSRDGNNHDEVITYEDGNVRVNHSDGSYDYTFKNGSDEVTISYDKDGVETKKVTVNTFMKETIIYEDGKATNKTTIYYDNSGNLLRTVEEDLKLNVATTKDANGVVMQTSYRDGQLVTEHNAQGVVDRITTHNDDGSTTLKTYTGEKDYTIVNIKDGVATPVCEAVYASDGQCTRTIHDAQRGDIVESYNANDVLTSKTGANGRTVSYDENGNTYVIVQCNETIKALADKFGVTQKAIIDANPDKVRRSGGRAYFNVGDEIVIPQHIEPDNEVLNGRLDKDGARAEYRRRQEAAAARRQAEAARQRAQQAPQAIAPEQRVLELNGGIANLKDSHVKISRDSDETYKYGLDENGRAWYYDNEGRWVGEDLQQRITNLKAEKTVKLFKQSPQILLKAAMGEYPDSLLERYLISKDVLDLVNTKLHEDETLSRYLTIGQGVLPLPQQLQTTIDELKVKARRMDEQAARANRITQSTADEVLAAFGGKERLLDSKIEIPQNNFVMAIQTYKYALDSEGNIWYYDNNGTWVGRDKQAELIEQHVNKIVADIETNHPNFLQNSMLLYSDAAINEMIPSKDVLDLVNAKLEEKGCQKRLELPTSVQRYIRHHASEQQNAALPEDAIDRTVEGAGSTVTTVKVNGVDQAVEYTIIGKNGFDEYVMHGANGMYIYATKNPDGTYSVVDNDFRDARTVGRKQLAGFYKESPYGHHYTMINGKVYYFDEDGNVLTGSARENIVKSEAAAIAMNIYCSDSLTGWNTDVDKITRALNSIYSNEIYEAVNAKIQEVRNYSSVTPGGKIAALEEFLLREETHEETRGYYRTLINNGVLTNDEIVNFAANELDWAISGRYANDSTINDILSFITNPETRRLFEAEIQRRHPELEDKVGADGSYVRAYIQNDGYTEIQTNMFMAKWVESGAYQEGYFVNGRQEGAVYDETLGRYGQVCDQAERNAILRSLFDSGDVDYLKKAFDYCDSGEDSLDMVFLRDYVEQEVQNDPDKYKEWYPGQDIIQRFIAGRSPKTEYYEEFANLVKDCNTRLYKGAKPAEAIANEMILEMIHKKAMIGDIPNCYISIFRDILTEDANEEIYGMLNDALKNGVLEGYSDLNQLYRASRDLYTVYSESWNLACEGFVMDIAKVDVNMACSEQIELSIDDIFSIGYSILSALVSGKLGEDDTNEAKLLLIKLLDKHPEVGDYLETSSGLDLGPYRDLIHQYTLYEVHDEPMFLDEFGRQIDNPAEVTHIAEYQNAIVRLSEYIAEMERGFRRQGLDVGTLGLVADACIEGFGWGTSTEDVIREYRSFKQLLSRLELAAQGRLVKDGKPVSAEDLIVEFLKNEFGCSESDSVEDLLRVMTEKLRQSESDNATTVGIGKMALILLPVIIATTVVTDGLALEGWAALAAAAATAGVTTWGMESLDAAGISSVDVRHDAYNKAAEDALIAAAMTMVGGSEMKLITKIPGATMWASAGKFVLAVSGDVAMGAAVEMGTTGQVTKEGMITCLVLSGVGNVIGYKQFRREPNGTLVEVAGETRGTSEPIRGELDRVASNGHARAGEVAPIKKQTTIDGIERQINAELGNPNTTPERLAQLRRELEALGGNKQFREAQINRIDEHVRGLNPDAQARYNSARSTNLHQDVIHILSSDQTVSPAELRQLREYMETLSPAELENFRQALDYKLKNHHGLTSDQMGQLNIEIDNRISAINRSNEVRAFQEKTPAEQKAHIDRMLQRQPGSTEKIGLNETQVAELRSYIEGITNPDELAAIQRQLRNVKNREPFRNAIEAKQRQFEVEAAARQRATGTEEQPQTGDVRPTEDLGSTEDHHFVDENGFERSTQSDRAWEESMGRSSERESTSSASEQRQPVADQNRRGYFDESDGSFHLYEEETGAAPVEPSGTGESHVESRSSETSTESRSSEVSTESRTSEASTTARPESEAHTIPSRRAINKITSEGDLLSAWQRLTAEESNPNLSNSQKRTISQRKAQIEERLRNDFQKVIDRNGHLQSQETTPAQTANKRVSKMDSRELEAECKRLVNENEHLNHDSEGYRANKARIDEIELAANRLGMTARDDGTIVPLRRDYAGMSIDELNALYEKVGRMSSKSERQAAQRAIEEHVRANHQNFELRNGSFVAKAPVAEHTTAPNVNGQQVGNGIPNPNAEFKPKWFGNKYNPQTAMNEFRLFRAKWFEKGVMPLENGKYPWTLTLPTNWLGWFTNNPIVIMLTPDTHFGRNFNGRAFFGFKNELAFGRGLNINLTKGNSQGHIIEWYGNKANARRANAAYNAANETPHAPTQHPEGNTGAPAPRQHQDMGLTGRNTETNGTPVVDQHPQGANNRTNSEPEVRPQESNEHSIEQVVTPHEQPVNIQQSQGASGSSVQSQQIAYSQYGHEQILMSGDFGGGEFHVNNGPKLQNNRLVSHEQRINAGYSKIGNGSYTKQIELNGKTYTDILVVPQNTWCPGRDFEGLHIYIEGTINEAQCQSIATIMYSKNMVDYMNTTFLKTSSVANNYSSTSCHYYNLILDKIRKF